MAKLPGHEPLYAAAEQFVDQCLRQDDSLFTPGKAIWTLESADDLYERFVTNADHGTDPFDIKLARQLEGADARTAQFTAELRFVYFLIPSNILASSKASRIEEVLKLLSSAVEVPDELKKALSFGIANLGSGNQRQQEYVRYLLRFVRVWKQLSALKREHTLADPWDFKTVAYQVSSAGAQAAREGLLHLVFPDTFERTVSVAQKQEIAKGFSYLVSKLTDDVDRQLLQIRAQLQAEQLDTPLNFYDKLTRPAWDPNSSEWDRFIHWANRLHRTPNFDESERIYKLDVGKLSRDARDAVRADNPGWLEVLRKSFGPPGNLVYYLTKIHFMDWCQEETQTARSALLALWDESRNPSDRLDAFFQLLPAEAVSGPSARLSITTNLLLGSDATGLPPYRYEPIYAGYKLTGYPPPDSKATDTEVYLHALAFFDKIMAEAAERGLKLRDRLDAQSVLWAVTKDTSLSATWPPEEHAIFEAYRKGSGVQESGNGDDGDDGIDSSDSTVAQLADSPGSSIDSLADDLLLDAGWLNDVVELLRAKKQIIFYGPPGTGKTYVALRLAEFLSGGVRPAIVQFHPSYAYEDFVQGFRPAESPGGQAVFRLVGGPLLRAAQSAHDDPDRTYVLIIDEINRGNLARVLGELYFLLEYRDHEIRLQYSNLPFALPENLWIIGTMNTADRSIALIDAALRRRFFFVPFFPDQQPVQGLLANWLARNRPGLGWVAEMVDRANEGLNDRHLSIGPSYFMRADLDEAWVRRIWTYQIIPYLEEHFFDDPSRVEEFAFDRLRGLSAGNGTVAGEELKRAEDLESESPTAH